MFEQSQSIAAIMFHISGVFTIAAGAGFDSESGGLEFNSMGLMTES